MSAHLRAKGLVGTRGGGDEVLISLKSYDVASACQTFEDIECSYLMLPGHYLYFLIP